MSSWIKVLLKDIASIEYGKSQSDIAVTASQFPIYGTGGVVGFAQKPLFKSPLILIGRKGTIDKPIFINHDCWLIDTTYGIKPKDNTDIKYLYYFLTYFKLEKLNEATGVPSLSRENLFSISLLLPPLPEQKKIAEILTSVDRVIELTSMEIDKLKDLKKGMMQELLTKGIGHTKFKDSPVGKIPESWAIKEVKDLFLIEDGKRKPIKSEDRTNISGQYPYYGASGIIDFVNDFIFSEPRILLGEDGENIISRNLPLAFIATGKYWVNNHAHVLNPMENDIYFMVNFLESLDYKVYSSGSAQPKLTLSAIQKIKVATPPIEEQKSIGKLFSDLEFNLNIKCKKLKRLSDLKKGLMNDLLTGKVRVN